MPIYEYYCPDCHELFNFFARTFTVKRLPDCPRCGRKRLDRQISTFAVTGSAAEPASDGLPPGFDETRMERAMGALERESAGIDENDPRQAAGLMRKFGDMTGIPIPDSMKQAMARMEAGEAPESVEADLGPAMEADSAAFRLGGTTRHRPPPRHDETLYDLP